MIDGTNMYTYKRTVESPFYESNKSGSRGQKVLNLFHAVKWNISLGLVLTGIVGFFLSRAVFWGELLPFAPAFAAATAVSYGRRGFLAVVFMCVGMATVLSGQLLAADIVLVVFSFLFTNALPRKYSTRRLVIPVIIFGLAISVKSAFLAFAGSTPYDYINVFFESVLAAVLVSACLVSLSSAKKFDIVQPLGGEETVCLLLLMAGIIAGTGDIQIWHISAKGLLSKIIILLAATAGGAGLGAAAGALVGIIPGVAYTVTPSLVGAHSFAGVLAGFGRSLGKIGVAIAFLASNVILTLYFNNTAVMVTVIAETVVACLVLLMVPEGLIQKVSSSIIREVNKGQDDYERQYMSRAFKEKLWEYSKIFKELARVFGENNPLAEKKDNEDGIKRLLNEISQKVCTGCPMYSLCWEKEYYRTYQNMLDMFTLSELYGRLKITDIPDELKLRCTRSRELAVTAACLYETFKVGSYWKSKFSAGKGVVGDQLRGLSSVIDNLADVFNLGHCACEDTDTTLKHKLRQLGIPVREIKIYQLDSRREIQVTMKACNGELDCKYKLAPLISELLGQVFSAAGCVCEGVVPEGSCKFLLYQCPQYRIDVGFAGAAKDGGISGDNCDFIQLREGRFAAILSDGMGTGANASEQSNSVIRVMRRMIEAGLDLESAVKSVNAVLALKSTEESFATLDMSVINLNTGVAEFVKIAAPPTYLIRGGKVKSIHANTLPVGILNDIDVSITEKKLISGDVVVMLTDGILDACADTQNKDKWINNTLQELDGLEPREMAQLLLKLAQTCEANADKPGDDMAVVVIKIEKENVVELPR